ncbi:MAG: tetratricopeptide repeat protein [Chloroflexota bacterium]
MSQRKKQPDFRADPSTTRASGASPRERSRRQPSRGQAQSRRRITFGIVVVGFLIAVWVLTMSFGSGAGGSSAQPPSQAQKSSDLKDVETAIANLQERLRQNPTDTVAMIELGNSYYDAGRWAESIPWYEKALEAIPANTDVRTDLGTSYFYSGNLEKAKEQWFKVLEQDPNKVQTHYNLAVLFSHMTPPDTDNAVKEWEAVIRVAPDSEQAKAAEKRLKELGKR